MKHSPCPHWVKHAGLISDVIEQITLAVIGQLAFDILVATKAADIRAEGMMGYVIPQQGLCTSRIQPEEVR